ncbi:glycosyltransferase [bacterium C-53]|nr:glycosyltransferase [Lachnospiraceae bacterium]NBI04370.1 glycosyltransferase [Lachnospiraceae bacterium]RKJ08270.1 glycosyltransferase [bacterium C-53]
MDKKEKNFLSAVIYVHNAEAQIEKFLRMVKEVLEENFEHSEIICVNDDSRDRSVSVIRNVSAEAVTSSISILNMSYFHGLEMAMNAGVDLAIGDFVLEFDLPVSDFDRAEIMNVYYRALRGFDIVSASPERKEKLSSTFFYKVFDRFSEMTGKMSTERFRILSRRVINRISSMNKTVPYRKVVYAACGLKTDHIKYHAAGNMENHYDRKEKNYRFGLAVDTLILFTEMGYWFSLSMTLFMMLMSVIMIAYSVTVYIASHPVAGWTTTVLFLSVAFFGLFGILTIVIKYLQLLVDLVFKRKHYSFESIEKLTK